MRDVTRLHPVTRIRGELTTTPEVKAAVDRYLETPIKQEAIKLYTTAQVYIDQRDFYGSKFDKTIKEIEDNLRLMGHHAFTLAKPMLLSMTKGGGGQLFFSVAQKEQLQMISDEIRRLPTLETGHSPGSDMLYAEIARGSLTANLVTRRNQMIEADRHMTSDLNHPRASLHMVARGLQLVKREVAVPVRQLGYLPDEA